MLEGIPADPHLDKYVLVAAMVHELLDALL